MVMSPVGPRTKNDCAGRRQHQFTRLTEQGWALISTQNSSHAQLTGELNPGTYELSWDHQVPSYNMSNH
jgi:hypothetical protein